MKKVNQNIFFILILIHLINSCNNINQNDENKKSITSKLTKKEFYQNKMKNKKFLLENNGPCNDALNDTKHKRGFAYINSKKIIDANAIIEFKFKEACCQEFLGDYTIDNDTLKFKFEQVNNTVCSCLCWYKYKLTINETKQSYKYIKIVKK